MYHDYLLKFDTEADALAALYDQIPTEFDEDGNVTATEPRQKYHAIDTIGVIYKPTGEMLQGEDGEYPEMAPIEGWHVNVRHTEPAPELDVHAVLVDVPVRRWADSPPKPPTVPSSITRAQAIGALILAGMDGLVQPAIDAIADETQRKLVQNDWDNRLHFERTNPTLIALATALGMTDTQINDLFIAGARL